MDGVGFKMILEHPIVYGQGSVFKDNFYLPGVKVGMVKLDIAGGGTAVCGE